jgi:TRAP transporter TAXI family solute receptor
MAVAAALAAAGGASAQQISIGTSPQGTASYSMGAAIAKVINDRLGVPARVQPFTGNSIALPALNNGEVDLSAVNEVEAVEALNGDGSYQGRRQENLRMLSILYPFTTAMWVRKDSPLRTIADLKGRRVPWGYGAQLTLKNVVAAILANGGLTEADIQPVLVPNVNRGADDFASGKADTFFFALGTAKVTETDVSVGGLRALEMSDAPQALAAMQKLLPQGYIIEAKPRPGLAGIAEPTRTLAYDYTLVVGKHVKDDTAYRIAKALAEGKDSLVASFRGFAAFDAKRMAKKMDVQFHPGAIKYLQEAGQWPPR